MEFERSEDDTLTPRGTTRPVIANYFAVIKGCRLVVVVFLCATVWRCFSVLLFSGVSLWYCLAVFLCATAW